MNSLEQELFQRTIRAAETVFGSPDMAYVGRGLVVFGMPHGVGRKWNLEIETLWAGHNQLQLEHRLSDLSPAVHALRAKGESYIRVGKAGVQGRGQS
jgi:hypothetical protein